MINVLSSSALTCACPGVQQMQQYTVPHPYINMPHKRDPTEAELQAVRTTRRSSKRSRVSTSPSAKEPVKEDSSETSTVSDASTSTMSSSSSPTSTIGAAGSSSASTNDPESDVSVIVDTTGDDGESSADSIGPEEIPDRRPQAIIALSGRKKPEIDPQIVLDYARDLRARLNAFLPQLQQANNELATQGKNLNMEEVADEEQHIELSLGLGVLEQKAHDEQIRKAQPDEQSKTQGAATTSLDQDFTIDPQLEVMSQLFNTHTPHAKAGIQDLDTGNGT